MSAHAEHGRESGRTFATALIGSLRERDAVSVELLRIGGEVRGLALLEVVGIYRRRGRVVGRGALHGGDGTATGGGRRGAGPGRGRVRPREFPTYVEDVRAEPLGNRLGKGKRLPAVETIIVRRSPVIRKTSKVGRVPCALHAPC